MVQLKCEDAKMRTYKHCLSENCLEMGSVVDKLLDKEQTKDSSF